MKTPKISDFPGLGRLLLIVLLATGSARDAGATFTFFLSSPATAAIITFPGIPLPYPLSSTGGVGAIFVPSKLMPAEIQALNAQLASATAGDDFTLAVDPAKPELGIQVVTVATSSEPASGAGSIVLEQLSTSLAGNAGAPMQAASIGSLVLHGAHGRPLARRIESGKSCVWAAGDLGRDTSNGQSNPFGLGEVGGCHAFAAGVQGSLSLGQSWSRQNLVLNGHSDMRSNYGIAELLANIPNSNLWFSGSLLYQAGELSAQRGYLNGAVVDYSTGRPRVETAAIRLRLDWEGATRLRSVLLTPYVDISHARTHVDGYIETGGGFPARFDSRIEKASEIRLGADASLPLSGATNVIGKIEASHRFERTGSATSGTMLGGLEFNLAGRPNKRDWFRAGIGFESKFGDGKLGAMFNASNGPVENYWMNISYQAAF